MAEMNPFTLIQKDEKLLQPADAGIYYHYTSLKTLWILLDNETFWATQANFSNDSMELQKGIDLVQDSIVDIIGSPQEKNNNNDVIANLDALTNDCYIICFCKENDVLSQWRGYCRNDGVSIGYAYEKDQVIYIIGEEDGKKDITERSGDLYPVYYIGDTSENGQQVYKEDEMKGIIEQSISQFLPKGNQYNAIDPDFNRFLCELIPLIKDGGFKEEKELRLVIQNVSATNMIPKSSVEYNKGEDNVQSPHLRVSFSKYGSKKLSDTLKDNTRHPVYITYSNIFVDEQKQAIKNRCTEFWNDLVESEAKTSGLSEDVIKSLIPLYIEENKYDSHDSDSQVWIGDACLSVQKELFKLIDNELNGSVKIWCKGHIPIRSITVSPCVNQKEVVESIKHYIKHKFFWMKYVDVEISKIPFRRPKS